MTHKTALTAGRFFLSTGIWLAGLIALALVYHVGWMPPVGDSWTVGEIALLLPGWTGLLLPAAAFAGGIAVSGFLSSRAVAFRGLLLGVVTYGLLAYGVPLAEFERRAIRGGEMAGEYPFGPYTPGALKAGMDAVEAEPPALPGFRVSRPLDSPANWWSYRLHSVVVVSVFAVLAAVLGRWAGLVTRALPPPRRSNARWGLGLVTAGAFFVFQSIGGVWVRASPENSGWFGAWYALAVPLAELAILVALVRRRPSDSHGPPLSGTR